MYNLLVHIMTYWLNKTAKKRNKQYIDTKNKLNPRGFLFETLVRDSPGFLEGQTHRSMSADLFCLSDIHRWIYNIDIITVGGLIAEMVYQQAHDEVYPTFNFPDYYAMHIREDHGRYISVKLKQEYEAPMTKAFQQIEDRNLELLRTGTFENIKWFRRSFDYKFGVRLEIICPGTFLYNEEYVEEIVLDWKRNGEYCSKQVIGSYDPTELIEYLENNIKIKNNSRLNEK